MEQIKRANRLYTNDSIFLKTSLLIPVLSDFDSCSNGMDLTDDDTKKDKAGCVSAQDDHTGCFPEKKYDNKEIVSDLTPLDFLKRLDDLICQSKQAAVKGCQEAEKRYDSHLSSQNWCEGVFFHHVSGFLASDSLCHLVALFENTISQHIHAVCFTDT